MADETKLEVFSATMIAKLEHLDLDLQSIKNDLDTLRSDMKNYHDKSILFSYRLQDQDSLKARVNNLERFKWKLVGGMIIIGIIAPVAQKLIGVLL